MLRLLAILVVVGLVSWVAVTAFYPTSDTHDSATPPSLSDITFSNIGTTITQPVNSTTTSTPKPKLKLTNTMPTQPIMSIDINKKYSAVLHTTYGDITIALNAKQTPITVNNFVSLAQEKLYDSTIFHRVIKGFMIQGGDPKGDGTGGPGYRFNDEKFSGEYTRGTVAMANAGPNTNGSQFFIMHADVPLEKNYVIFGKVVNGMEVVDKIAAAAVMFSNGEKSRPVEPVVVNSVVITNE